MRQTVIGVFDRYADARHAAQLLHDSGFGDSVFLTDETAGDPGARPGAREGVLSHVGQFFSGLFKPGTSRDVRGYADTVYRGGAVVRVELDQEAGLDTVRDALQSAGAFEIEERAGMDAIPRTEPFVRDLRSDRRAPQSRLTGDTGKRCDFAAYDTDFRNDFETWYGGMGILYDDYEPAYRYGHALANDEAYAGRRWEDFEPDARREWERLHPRRAWQRIKTAVRHAWQRSMS